MTKSKTYLVLTYQRIKKSWFVGCPESITQVESILVLTGVLYHIWML